jgi:hypothetical protein
MPTGGAPTNKPFAFLRRALVHRAMPPLASLHTNTLLTVLSPFLGLPLGWNELYFFKAATSCRELIMLNLFLCSANNDNRDGC